MPGFSLSSLLAYIYPLHPLPNAGGLPEETLNAGSETTNIESIIKSYLIQQGYKARPRSLNIKLKEALVKEIVSSGVHYDANDLYTIKITDLAVATAQLPYPYNSFELQVHIAVYTWLATVIDDRTSRLDSDVKEFSRRFHEGVTQKSTLLNSYANNLRGLYTFYDPIVASTIIQSSLAFVDACILETRIDYQTMPQTSGGERWAHYFRVKNGITDAYVFIAFPQDIFPNASTYLQLASDLGDFIILCNDILSFYKEDLAGETRNYIQIRAKYENKDTLQVLNDVAKETVEAWARISKVVEDKGKIEDVCKEIVQGYCALHLSLGRYRLNEIGLGETIPFE